MNRKHDLSWEAQRLLRHFQVIEKKPGVYALHFISYGYR
jgi:hypothetical protein